MTTTIRFPVELRDRLKRIADRERRSVSNLLILWAEQAAQGYEREHPEIRGERSPKERES